MNEYDDRRRRELLAFVRWVAERDITAWYRDGEETATMSKADAARLAAIVTEARVLARRYSDHAVFVAPDGTIMDPLDDEPRR